MAPCVPGRRATVARVIRLDHRGSPDAVTAQLRRLDHGRGHGSRGGPTRRGHRGEHAVVGVVCHHTSMDVPPSGIHHREDGMAGECPREDA
jgi:hypothetical protein